MYPRILWKAVFIVIVVVTHFVLVRFGSGGIYTLAAIMGVTDVDPFILGLTQSAGGLTPLSLAYAGILIAAGSNNFVKGIYAYAFADRRSGLEGLGLLWGLAVCGVVPLLWR